MRTSTNSRNIVNNYWKVVKHLSPEAKIDLITMLSRSLVTEQHRIEAKKYYGIWGEDGIDDDEFVNELRSMRTFNREIIEL